MKEAKLRLYCWGRERTHVNVKGTRERARAVKRAKLRLFCSLEIQFEPGPFTAAPLRRPFTAAPLREI